MEHADLDSVVVPRFEFPWPGACHPHADQVEQATLAWGSAHGLIPDEEYLARVTRTRYGFLAARCYPRASDDLLQVIADYFLWFFLADDLFVDRVETLTSDTIGSLTAMIDVLDFDQPGTGGVYGESAWRDVCRRLRRLLSPEQFERFATGMRLWASTAGLQILHHLRPHPVSIDAYETIRRHTSGMYPCLALSDAAAAGPVPGGDYHQPVLHRLRTHANNVVCWSNDIQSLVVEARQPGQFRNLVTLYAAQGRSLQAAVDITAGRVRAEIAAFVELAGAAERGASRQVSGYLTGLKDWLRGYQDWYDHDTGRYGAVHAERDADDRDIPLR